MTTERITLPGVDDDANGALNECLAQLDATREINMLRATYYDGKHAIRYMGGVIPPQYYRLGIVLGWSGKAVDLLARRCNLDGFVWPGGDLDSIGMAELEEGNNLRAEVSAGIIASLIHGPAFLINTEGDTAAGEPAALIHVKDALNATGLWNARRRALDALLSITERDDKGEAKGLVLYLPGRTITAARGLGAWKVEDDQEHPWGVPAEVLAYQPRPGRAFGASRISKAVMSLHDQALRTVVRMEANADVYSLPDLWLLGADESIFKNADGSQKAAWQVVLGRIKGIPDDDDAEQPRADVKQFSAQTPQPHIDQLKQQAMLFSGETSIPLNSLGIADLANPTSADSYMASREDLVAEAEGATDDWGPALRRVVMRGLAMQNGLSEVPAAWRTIAAKWRSPVYLSRAAQADAGTKQISAIPWLAETEVGLELLGLDEQQITRAMAEKRRAQARAAMAGLAAAADRVRGGTAG